MSEKTNFYFVKIKVKNNIKICALLSEMIVYVPKHGALEAANYRDVFTAIEKVKKIILS